MTVLETMIDEARQTQTTFPPDVSEGLAFVFEDNPASRPLGIFTVGFAKALCESDALYVWRKV